MTAYVYVPGRGQRWRTGALVRASDDDRLYRVTSAPFVVAEDSPRAQRVAAVREPPPEYRDAVRLREIAAAVRARGMHTPESRGAVGAPAAAVAPMPEGAMAGAAEYEYRRDRYHHLVPYLRVAGDILQYVEPQMDDAPVVIWLRDAALAAEARTLIARRPTMLLWPRASVFGR